MTFLIEIRRRNKKYIKRESILLSLLFFIMYSNIQLLHLMIKILQHAKIGSEHRCGIKTLDQRTRHVIAIVRIGVALAKHLNAAVATPRGLHTHELDHTGKRGHVKASACAPVGCRGKTQKGLCVVGG